MAPEVLPLANSTSTPADKGVTGIEIILRIAGGFYMLLGLQVTQMAATNFTKTDSMFVGSRILGFVLICGGILMLLQSLLECVISNPGDTVAATRKSLAWVFCTATAAVAVFAFIIPGLT